jgi:hypothetical protein
LGVEGSDFEIRIGQVDDRVEVVVEGVDEGAQGGGFAGTDIAGDEGGQAFVQGEGEAGLEFLVGLSREEVLRGDGTREGGELEAIEIIEGRHQASPFGLAGV